MLSRERDIRRKEKKKKQKRKERDFRDFPEAILRLRETLGNPEKVTRNPRAIEVLFILVLFRSFTPFSSSHSSFHFSLFVCLSVYLLLKSNGIVYSQYQAEDDEQ